MERYNPYFLSNSIQSNQKLFIKLNQHCFAMPKKNFILLSMEDEKIKKISNVISNDSCRKILDYLANKEATESELASKLSIPISTVHYNLQQLMETGLIDADEYHYSEKGKEVNHYRLANKYIIIAPKKTYGIKEKLKGILPVLLIISGAALVIQLTYKFFAHGGVVSILSSSKQTLVRETLVTTAQDAGISAKSAAIESAPQAMGASQIIQNITNATTEYLTKPEVTTQVITTPPSVWSNIAIWFLAGALFALGVYLAIKVVRRDVD